MSEPISEQQIIDDFKTYEGITIERLDEHKVRATFQEQFGEGSVTGDSVLHVLIHAVRRQKVHEYWQGYAQAGEEQTQEITERLDTIEEQLADLGEITNQLKAVETAIQLLAGNIINLRTELLVIKSIVAKGEQEE